EGGGLGGGPVVAVDQTLADGLAALIDQADRRALAGQPDGYDLGLAPKLTGQAGQCSDGGGTPTPGILLRPAGSRRGCGVAATDLEESLALDTEGGGARPGGADVDG